MVKNCTAHGCKEKFVKGGSISFHRFPKNQERRDLWEKCLCRENFKATDASLLCSKHFTADCFDKDKFGGTWLKSDAVPTIFEFPPHLQIKFNEIKMPEIKKPEEISYTPYKRLKYVGDFTEEVLESPENAKLCLEVATEELNKKSKIIKHLRQKERRMQKRLEKCQEVIDNLKKKVFLSYRTQGVLKSSGTSSKEEENKTDHIPLEPTVEIKEEPVDYDPTPSTSIDTANEEFILPHKENTWSPPVHASPVPVVEPQFTLSVANLAPANEPEASDGEQVRKKRKAKTSTFVPSTNGPEVRSQSPVYNFGEVSNPDSSKELRKDQFDVFGEYIAAKLRSLDRKSCAYAQRAIGDIIFEAEMGKYLNENSESQGSKNCAS